MAAKQGAPGKRRQPKAAPPAGHDATLSRDRIVATAVDLLDSEGVDGLTMRALADRLGSGVMSLYWHVANKDDVFDLALDSVLEYREAPSGKDGGWREEAVHILEDWRARMLDHPWSASLLPRRALGASILSRLELLGRALSRAGVADADLNAAIWSLWNYVMGATITRASFEVPYKERTAVQERLGEQHPTIERTRLLLDNDWDGAFRKGLDYLLDGLAPR